MLKYQINEMLNGLPMDKDIEISIIRTMGDHLTFYNYEKYKLRLFDEHLIFYDDDGKEHKVLYKNIKQFQWKPVTDTKIGVIEGDYKTKN